MHITKLFFNLWNLKLQIIKLQSIYTNLHSLTSIDLTRTYFWSEIKKIATMNKLILNTLLIAIIGCSNAQEPTVKKETKEPKKQTTHRYGGWYCPDNLYGFPAVNFDNWSDVPVITDRLPTKEDVQTEASLIFVDTEKYPDAKPLEISLPRLATYYTHNTDKQEPIIVIQAIKVEGDSIVGFRYLNGGNGSARINEVNFILESQLPNIKNTQFVDFEITINTNDEKVWQVMTDASYLPDLRSTFDKSKTLGDSWSKNVNMNYQYASNTESTAKFGQKHFGCYYIQNDYLIDNYSFVDKFLLRMNDTGDTTTLRITCGPFKGDYEMQKQVLNDWAQKVKELCEK